MKVEKVMTRNAITISPEATVVEAARKMRDKNVGSLVVVEEGTVVGITTDRLLALSVPGEGLDPRGAKVRDSMSENVISVSPEMDLSKAAKLFEELEIRYLPVVKGKKEKLVGIVSVADIAYFAREFMDCVFMEVEARARKRKK